MLEHFFKNTWRKMDEYKKITRVYNITLVVLLVVIYFQHENLNHALTKQKVYLTPELRELAINRILALGGDGDIDIDDIKWVIMMVLFNNEEDESSLWHYEDMVFDDQPAYFH